MSSATLAWLTVNGWSSALTTRSAGFGLLGHLYQLVRANGVSAVTDSVAVPCLDGACDAVRDGYVSGGTQRKPGLGIEHADLSCIDGVEALLLADAQTSGGLLLVGEIPGTRVIGELMLRGEDLIKVR